MNKIVLDGEKLVSNVDSSINCNYSTNSINNLNTLIIDVLSDSDLSLCYNFLEFTKLEVIINVKFGVKLNVYEILSGSDSKIRVSYFLDESACANVYKFNDIDSVFEYVIVYLNGRYSSINYNFKTIACNKEKYDFLIYHNSSDTTSSLYNGGVNINDGNIFMNVSSFVKNGNKNCNVCQNNRIINLTDNECVIKPNLYIDEYDTSANHSALIGGFDSDCLFYLMSRGIDRDSSIKLLIKGFLTDRFECNQEFSKKIEDIVFKYWR